MAQAAASESVGQACPKCAYVRTAADRNPAWQCPNCHIAYAKAGAKRAFVSHGREMAHEARADNSLFVLIAVNIIVLVIAHYMKLSLRGLMLVYWMQSAVIGACHVYRITQLKRFATDGFRINNQPVDETPATRAKTATFFAIHFGFFHVGYLVFLSVAPSKAGTLAAPAAYLLCGAAFAFNHIYSLRHNIAKDAAGRPNIGTLMFLPYARTVPMHVTICTGFLFHPGPYGLLFFGVLKTAADALMHTVEHHVLKAKSGSEPDS